MRAVRGNVLFLSIESIFGARDCGFEVPWLKMTVVCVCVCVCMREKLRISGKEEDWGLLLRSTKMVCV